MTMLSCNVLPKPMVVVVEVLTARLRPGAVQTKGRMPAKAQGCRSDAAMLTVFIGRLTPPAEQSF